MPRHATFWRNLTVVGLLHVGALVGLTRWSNTAQRPLSTQMVWMDANAATALVSAPAPSPMAESPEPEPTVAIPAETPPPMEDPLTMRTPPLSEPEIETPTPKPSATATPRATATPKPSATPKPTPKTKKLVAKSSPAPRPKSSATPARKLASAKPEATPKEPTDGGSGASNGGGTGQGSGAGGAARANSYGKILHDRFFSEWNQPTSVVSSGARMSALVRIRIEKDGRVSAFNIIRGSGNVVVDESVAAVAQRVTQVEPPPAGLGSAGHYDVNINFELNAE